MFGSRYVGIFLFCPSIHHHCNYKRTLQFPFIFHLFLDLQQEFIYDYNFTSYLRKTYCYRSPLLDNIYLVVQISSNCKDGDDAFSQLYPLGRGRNNLVSIMGMIYGGFPHLIVSHTFVELAECDSYNVSCHLQGGRDGIYPLQMASK